MVLYDSHGRPVNLGPSGSNRQTPIDDTVGPKAEQDKASKNEEYPPANTPTPVRSESELKEIPEKNSQSYQDRNYRQQWWLFGAQAATFIATALAFFAAWHYARIAGKQKDIMALQSFIMNQAFAENRRQSFSVERSAQAALSAANTARMTLGEIKSSGVDTHTLAEAAKSQADNTRVLAEQTKIALHITERAYIVAEPPELSPATHTVKTIFNNIGHIPSGRLEIIIHEATIDLESSGQLPDLKKAAEWHWSQRIVQALPPGPGLTVNVPVVLVHETKMQQGLQTIVIVGKFRYQDGFPDDGIQNALFCFQTLLLTEEQRVVWRERDPIGILRKMEALDGYPRNGQQDR